MRRPTTRGARALWRRLSTEQRLAAGAALMLVASTLGPFGWTEAAVVLVALSVVLLVERRAAGRRFHLPFGDGGVIAAAGAWCAVLIALRVLERPLGQSLLALACAGLLVATGLRQRARGPADDLPAE